MRFPNNPINIILLLIVALAVAALMLRFLSG